MRTGEILLIIGVSALTSYLTTKIITIHYFKIIDGYVKRLFEDTKKVLRNTTLNKEFSKRS